jgi:putative flippase GtrA
MFDWREPGEWKQLFRYYQAGLVNTLFGYGAYVLFVWLGLDMYVAQIVAHVLGTAFNYLTYSRYAFAGRRGSVLRFVASYVGSYLLSLATLAGFAQVTSSPYLAGLLSVVLVSFINFFVLKRLVFRPEARQA